MLITRLLLIITIVLAFANPIDEKDQKNNKNLQLSTSIIIDNNLLLQNTINNIPAIDLLKQEVIGLVKKSNQKKFNIITNNAVKKQLSKEDAIQFTSAIQPIYNKLDTIAIKKNESELNYVFSNFYDENLINYLTNLDTNLNYQFISLASSQKENLKLSKVFIDENNIELNKSHILNFSVHNTGNEIRSTNATLYLNQEVKQILSFKIPSKKTIDTFFNVYPVKKINEGVISIDDSPIYFDNNFHFNFIANSKYKTLLVNDSRKLSSIEIFLKNYENTDLKKIDLKDLNLEKTIDFDVIIINEPKFIDNNTLKFINEAYNQEKTIIIIPASNINTNSINSLSKKYNLPYFNNLLEKDTIHLFPNLSSDFYTIAFDSEVDKSNLFPDISLYFKSINNGANSSLITDKEFEKFTFLEQNNDRGNLFLFYFPFEKNINWTFHPLFTVTLMRIYETSEGNKINYSSLKTITKIKEKNIDIDAIYKIKTTNNEIILSKNYFENNSYLTTPYKKLNQGNFELMKNDSLIRYVSLNYPTIDSVITTKKQTDTFYTKKLLKINDFNNSINVTSNTQWYKVLILLALLFIIFEILIIRFYK